MIITIDHQTAATLGFDLPSAVAAFAAAIEAHKSTVDIPAPTAHHLVEAIVGQHGGQFVVEAAPEPEPDPEENPPPPPVPNLTFAQLLIGLVAEGWITEAEGTAWLAGTLPANVETLIASLPAPQRFAARARALAPSAVLRDDPLVIALGAAQEKTPEQLDAFFVKAAAL